MNLRTSVRDPHLLVLLGLAGALLAGACQLSTKSLGDESATGDGGGSGSSDGGGGGSSDGSGDGSSDGGDTGDDGGSGSSTTTDTQTGGTTAPPCEPIPLEDVAGGVGGFVVHGETGWSRSAGMAGDVNGDGLADVIVGEDNADPNGPDSGRTYVVFGKADTDSVAAADLAQGIGGFVLDGEGAGARSGHSVSGAGDVNGDGLADVIVGAPGAFVGGDTYVGRSYVVFGKTDTDPVSLADVTQGIGGFAVDGESSSDDSGCSVSEAGDANGDGLADVIVGTAGGLTSNSKRAYVVFGKTDTDLVALADVT